MINESDFLPHPWIRDPRVYLIVSTDSLSAESAYESRALGGMLGLLIGDAVGVPYEFHEPESIPPLGDLSYEPPPGFRRAHAGVPPGTWSDDGAQALCLLASLLNCDRLDLDDFGARLVRWYDQGEMAVNGQVFDVGLTTREAILRIKSGVPAAEAGSEGTQSNGNGALMRVLPLAIWHTGTDAELIHDARRQSLVTHGHLRSQLCCALYCLWARAILQGVDAPYGHAVQALRSHLKDEPEALRELNDEIKPDDPAIGDGSGYVVESLHSARFAAEAPTFADTIRRAIRLGHDTDTTACIAGGIAGLHSGLSSLPEAWRKGLLGQKLAIPLIWKLQAHLRNWLASEAGQHAPKAAWPPEWCLIGNIVESRAYGPGGRERRPGTRHFAAGTKVWVASPRWDAGSDRIRVLGRHRGSKRLCEMVVRAEWVTNWRAKVVYHPEILRRLHEHSGSWSSEQEVQDYLVKWQAMSEANRR